MHVVLHARRGEEALHLRYVAGYAGGWGADLRAVSYEGNEGDGRRGGGVREEIIRNTKMRLTTKSLSVS